MLQSIKPLGYTRYGDDFVLWCKSEQEARAAQIAITQFLTDELYLTTNTMHDRVQPVQSKLAYLGVEIWPNGHRLAPKTMLRIDHKLDSNNTSVIAVQRLY